MSDTSDTSDRPDTVNGIIEKRVKGIVMKQLGVDEDEVSLDKSFIDDLGADSLDIVEFVMAMEDEFEMEIPPDDAEDIRTVGDAIQYIYSHQS